MKIIMYFLVPLFTLGCSGVNEFVKSSDSLKGIDINGGEVRGFSFRNRLLPARISCSKETPMHIASKQGNIEMIKMLYSKGAIVNIICINDNSFRDILIATNNNIIKEPHFGALDKEFYETRSYDYGILPDEYNKLLKIEAMAIDVLLKAMQTPLDLAKDEKTRSLLRDMGGLSIKQLIEGDD